jgi:hypothetical protein
MQKFFTKKMRIYLFKEESDEASDYDEKEKTTTSKKQEKNIQPTKSSRENKQQKKNNDSSSEVGRDVSVIVELYSTAASFTHDEKRAHELCYCGTDN